METIYFLILVLLAACTIGFFFGLYLLDKLVYLLEGLKPVIFALERATDDYKIDRIIESAAVILHNKKCESLHKEV